MKINGDATGEFLITLMHAAFNAEREEILCARSHFSEYKPVSHQAERMQAAYSLKAIDSSR